MSTTNPSNPGGGRPKPATGPTPGEGPGWPHGGLDAPDEHGGGGGVRPEALAAGHEPDQFQFKPVLAIPAAVVATFIVAFLVTAAVFWYFMSRPGDPMAHPAAADRNKVGLNQRLQRIDHGKEVDQPRLEQLRLLTNNGQLTTQTELHAGNPPLVHADQVKPDPERNPQLYRSGPTAEKGVSFVPLSKIEAAVADPAVAAALFPVQPNAVKTVPSADSPSHSSAGRGQSPPAPKPEAAAGQEPAGKGKDKK